MAVKLEVYKKFETVIEDALVDSYRRSAEYGGRVGYKVYMWSDGEIETLEVTPGSNDFLVAKDWEDRKLYYLASIFAHVEDDVEDEVQIDELADWFRDEQVWVIMDIIKEEAERWEE